MPDLLETLARLFAHTPAAVFSTLSLGLLALAGALAFRALRLTTGTTTGGTIVGWHKRTSDGEVSYAPVMRFHAEAAGEFEVQSQTVFEKEAGGMNEPVTVRYDPANPRRADIEGRHHPWRPAIALLVLAAGTLAVAWQAGGHEETYSGGDIAGELALP